MRQNHRSLSLFMATLIALSTSLHAQEMDIEQADSLNFQSFHKDKKAAIKAWEKPAETVKAYDDKTTAAKPAQRTTLLPTDTSATTATVATPAAASSNETQGKRFEMRERYTLTRSAQTPYSAFYVIEPLYKQAAQLCVKGWKKIAERSEPVEQDFYLYFEIECL